MLGLGVVLAARVAWLTAESFGVASTGALVEMMTE
jgi:hypothetical protein